MTEARIGYGTLFKVRTSTGPDVFTTIGEQTNVTPFGVAVDSVDASHEQSPNQWREFIPGLKDGGECAVELNYVPGGTAEATLMGMLATTQVCRVTFPNGAHVDFSAFITEMSAETPIDDKMALSVTLKVTGEIVMSAAAAPTNAALPSIGGIPQVGQTLTAYEGAWNNEPTSFTYQWKSDTVNIGGATSKTYVPIIGQIAATLTVAVTGTNSAGSATATSAGAIDVIAA
ncbi:phage tail tube protein [Tardiphaga sp. 862_B3_N1_1]|uniref:phage tail tube protein n=1 Tax=Tardiphaga sp. 862_B3_N1_1 TaxID=3240763 RepID=UPI003F8CB1F3